MRPLPHQEAGSWCVLSMWQGAVMTQQKEVSAWFMPLPKHGVGLEPALGGALRVSSQHVIVFTLRGSWTAGGCAALALFTFLVIKSLIE